MTQENQDGWAIGGGGNSFPFENVGDYVTGIVFEYEPNLPQTDPKTGEAKFWPSGQARVMHRVGLHVEASSSPTVVAGTDASLYLKGGVKVGPDGSGPTEAVVLAAIKAAVGHNRLQPGAKLTVQYVGSKGNGPGISDTKLYKAWYEGPSFVVGPPDAGPPNPTVAPVTAPPGPVAVSVPVAQPAAAPSPPPVGPATAAASPPGLTPEQLAQLAALQAAQAPQAEAPAAWDADPRVAPLRAAGTSDAIIRQVLGI